MQRCVKRIAYRHLLKQSFPFKVRGLFVFLLAMANCTSYAKRCADLKRWLLQHHGTFPKRKSKDNAEASLANWLSMTLPRRFRDLGSKANQKQLTPAEFSQLDDAMGSAIIAERDDLAAKLQAVHGELAVKDAQLKMAHEKIARKADELTGKDAGIKDLKRKIAELQFASANVSGRIASHLHSVWTPTAARADEGASSAAGGDDLDAAARPARQPACPPPLNVRSTAQRKNNLKLPWPCNVCIYRYTDQASDLWDLFDGKDDVPLFQVQINHEARQSLTFQMRDSFNDFLASAKDDNGTMPANVQQLEAVAGVKLVVGDPVDPEKVGFQPWRVAFYCTDALNFLCLLDGWFQYKAQQIAREQPVQVVLHSHVGIDLSGLDGLSYEHYVINEPAVQLPLHIFDAQPVVGKRITVLHLQISNDSEVDLVITGQTWPFRARLDAFGIASGYKQEENGEARRYYRVWRQIDVAGGGASRFMEMLGTVFKNVALRVTLDAQPVPDTHVAAFIDKMRQVPSLFFEPMSEPTVTTMSFRDAKPAFPLHLKV